MLSVLPEINEMTYFPPCFNSNASFTSHQHPSRQNGSELLISSTFQVLRSSIIKSKGRRNKRRWTEV